MRDDLFRKSLSASRFFSPAAPVATLELFVGRAALVGRLVDAVNHRGRHALVLGERGVGKTSLVSALAPCLESPGRPVAAPLVTCARSDSFASVWRKMGARLQRPWTADTPEAVVDALRSLDADPVRVLVFDALDQPSDPAVRGLFAETLERLQDEAVAATLVLVGSADTPDELLGARAAAPAALPIVVPRMWRTELQQIVDVGLSRLEMSIDEGSRTFIAELSLGLPSWTHALALLAARDALEGGETRVRLSNVRAAIVRAVEEAPVTLQHAYARATASGRNDNLYGDVLLACALAERTPAGSFSATAVRAELRKITGKPYGLSSFAPHVRRFCDERRGPLLRRGGTRGLYRFRFGDPLMEPFVLLRGFASGRLRGDALCRLMTT